MPMNLLPPVATWDGFHPLVIHFPIALLLVAPVFIVAGLAAPRQARSSFTAAVTLMGLGVVAAWVAVASGHAAAELVEQEGAVRAVLQRHAELGEMTRNVFTALTLAFAAFALGPTLLKRPLSRGVTAGLGLLFLVVYAAGALLIANTAHQGARLVHEFGVHAVMAGESSDSIAPGPRP
jgi:uncharacterized membrane protein